MSKVLGVALAVMAVALVVVPMFTDCESQGKHITLPNGKEVSMKCHWSGVAEIGVGVPLFLVGAMMVASRRRSSQLGLGVMGITLGALAIAFPGGLIGVCQTPTMTCVTAMRPALIGLGGLTIAASLVGIVMSRRMVDA